jgi:hypothetical protein
MTSRPVTQETARSRAAALPLASTRVVGRVALPIVTPIEEGVVVAHNRFDPIAVQDSA